MSKFQMKRISSEHSIIQPTKSVPDATFPGLLKSVGKPAVTTSRQRHPESLPINGSPAGWPADTCHWDQIQVWNENSLPRVQIISRLICFSFFPAPTVKSSRGYYYYKSLQLWVNSGVLHGSKLWLEVWGVRGKGRAESSVNIGGIWFLWSQYQIHLEMTSSI